MKVLYGLLNWKRDILTGKRSLTKLIKSSEDKVLVLTDDITKWKKTKFEIDEADKSVAVSKNKFLQMAKDESFDYCVIFEDDVIVKEKNVIQQYIKLMEKYDLNVCMNGYINKNYILDKRPNPCIIVRTSISGDEVYINRYPCSAVMIFKVRSDMVMFDEALPALETEFLLHDMKQFGQINFNGFFFDLQESYKKIKRDDSDQVRVSSPQLNQMSLDIRKQQIGLDNNADQVLNYIKERM